MAANLMVPVAGLLDVAFLAHLDDIGQLAGVALATVLFDYVFWTFGFLRMGTTGLTARAVGRRDRDETVLVALRGVALALLLGGGLLLAQVPLREAGFALLAGDPPVEAAGRAYWDARILAAPFTLVGYVLVGWLLGRERGRHVLAISLAGNLTNAVLDWAFVVRLGLGAAGAGYATALADAVAAAVALALARDAFPAARRLAGRLRDRAALGELVALNRDLVVRTLALVSSFAVFTNLGAALGAGVLATNTVLLRVQSLAAYLVDGLAFATEGLVGALHAAGERARVAELLRLALGLGLAVGLAVAGAFAAFPDALFGVLSDHPAVLSRAGTYAPWLLAVLAFGSAGYVLDGYFIGLARGATLRRTMLASALLGFAPLAALAGARASNHLLWLAMAAFMAARALTLGLAVPATLAPSAPRDGGGEAPREA